MELLLALLSLLTAQASATPLSHGWGPLTSMMWADFRAPNQLTEGEAQFIAKHYAAVSLEKCTMESDGDTTEQGQLATARQLKRANPALKVLAYWGVDMQGYQCSGSARELHRQHPDYFLSNPTDGSPVMEKAYPQLDYRRQEARDWWVAAPLAIGGPDSSQLIDGILADGAGPRQIGSETFANFSLAEREALANGSLAVLRALQTEFDKANEGLVLCNGISMYPNRYNPGTPMLPDNNFGIVHECDGVETEHLAAFESRDHTTGKLNITRVRKNLELIERASAMNKSVMINMWAGPVVRPNSWAPSGTTPNTTQEWRAALEQHFNFSAALYLAVAAPTVFFEYVEWYPVSSGVVSSPIRLSHNNLTHALLLHARHRPGLVLRLPQSYPLTTLCAVGLSGSLPHVHRADELVPAGLPRRRRARGGSRRQPRWYGSVALFRQRRHQRRPGN